MSEVQKNYNVFKNLFDWTFSSTGFEIVIFEEDNMGRCIILDGMKVAAKVVVVDNLIRITTIEDYAVQIDSDEKIITVIKEGNDLD